MSVVFAVAARMRRPKARRRRQASGPCRDQLTNIYIRNQRLARVGQFGFHQFAHILIDRRA